MALAVHLANAGRNVTAVRTSTDEFAAPRFVAVTVHGSDGKTFRASVEMVSLASLQGLPGVIVVTAKSYANDLLAARLREMEVGGPLVILQNGVGVEDPYLAPWPGHAARQGRLDGLGIYRCVLYLTGQKHSDEDYTFYPVTASPIGIVRGDEGELARLVRTLHTGEFPFTALPDIRQEVWKKATINAVFNSICPLLEIDNGIFVRDERTARLAREVVDECVAITARLGFSLAAEDVMAQLFAISRRSSGQLISTLQDINQGRETEIDDLNLAIARIGASVAPDLKVSTTRALGELVKIKSILKKTGRTLDGRQRV